MMSAAARIIGVNQIIMIGGPEHRLKTAEELGLVDHTINIFEERDEDLRIEKVVKMTPHALSPDIVAEYAGVTSAFLEGLRMLRREGVLVEMGNLVNYSEIVELPLAKLITDRGRSIIGSVSSRRIDFLKALNALDRNIDRIPFDKIVDKLFKVEDTAEAFETAEKREGIKVAVYGPAYKPV